MNEKTIKSKLVLNKIKPESYAIRKNGYVLYKDKIKTENKHNIKEKIKTVFIIFTIDLSIFFISKINLLSIYIT